MHADGLRLRRVRVQNETVERCPFWRDIGLVLSQLFKCRVKLLCLGT